MQEISGEDQIPISPGLPVGGTGAATEDDTNTMVHEEAALQNLSSIEMPAHAAGDDVLEREMMATETSQLVTMIGEQLESVITVARKNISLTLSNVRILHPMLTRIDRSLSDWYRPTLESLRKDFSELRKGYERAREYTKGGQGKCKELLQGLEQARKDGVKIHGLCDDIQEDASSLLENTALYEKIRGRLGRCEQELEDMICMFDQDMQKLENDIIRMRELESDYEYCLHEIQVIEEALANVLR